MPVPFRRLPSGTILVYVEEPAGISGRCWMLGCPVMISVPS